MKLQPTERFRTDYERLPQRLQHRVDKALGLLLENPRHPSLQIHYRFTFTLEGDTYVLLRVGTHDLLK